MQKSIRYSYTCLLHVSSDMDSARLLGGLFFARDFAAGHPFPFLRPFRRRHQNL